MTARIAVFASGGGSNLQALLDHFAREPAAAAGRIQLVISDRADAGALARAERAGVATAVIAARGRDAEDIARETLAVLAAHEISLVALAGYLRQLPVEVVRRYSGRMLNIHPALLPAFGGKGMYGERVHAAVIAAGASVSGVTVHLVDEEYDSGRILAQWPVPVLAKDTPATLAARVLRVEHRLYPVAVEALARAHGEQGLGIRGSDAIVFQLHDGEAPSDHELRTRFGLE